MRTGLPVQGDRPGELPGLVLPVVDGMVAVDGHYEVGDPGGTPPVAAVDPAGIQIGGEAGFVAADHEELTLRLDRPANGAGRTGGRLRAGRVRDGGGGQAARPHSRPEQGEHLLGDSAPKRVIVAKQKADDPGFAPADLLLGQAGRDALDLAADDRSRSGGGTGADRL